MLRAFLLATVLLFTSALSWAESPTWPMDSYSYYANNSTLKQIIKDFATGFGLSTNISAKVHGVLSGRVVAKNPTEFMNRMASMFGLHWFTHAGTLYVSAADEAISRSIRVPTATLAQIRSALIDLGILDARFGWGELNGENIIMVSGPPAYVDLVLKTIKQLPIIAGGMKVAVFRVRHASVIDRTINFRGKSISTPGLATILQTLLMGKDIPNLSVETNQKLKNLSTGLKPLPTTDSTAIKMGETNQAGSLQPQESTQVDSSHLQSLPNKNYAGPTIQADPRLNAIIIKDIPERLEIYKHLIDELDVPTALVEIEAMIIDVNTSKLQDLGINWGTSFHGGQFGVGFGNPNDTSDGNGLSVGFAQNGTVSPNTLLVSASNYFISRLHMMENNGDARIQSRPSILTEENRGAILDFSETFYIRSVGERVANVQPITVGTSLRVTPRVLIQKNGKQGIMLSIDIEDGQIEEQRRIDNMPTVRESTISTEALVHQNQSLLIGGYNHDENTATIARVPILGHLPLIGLLFSKKSTSIQRRERLFMIRPHIVYLPWKHTEDGQDMANDDDTAPAGGVQPVVHDAPSSDSEVHVVQIHTQAPPQSTKDWAQKTLPSQPTPITPSLSFDPAKNWQPPVPPRQKSYAHTIDTDKKALHFPSYSRHDYLYTPQTPTTTPGPHGGMPTHHIIPASQNTFVIHGHHGQENAIHFRPLNTASSARKGFSHALKPSHRVRPPQQAPSMQTNRASSDTQDRDSSAQPYTRTVHQRTMSRHPMQRQFDRPPLQQLSFQPMVTTEPSYVQSTPRFPALAEHRGARPATIHFPSISGDLSHQEHHHHLVFPEMMNTPPKTNSEEHKEALHF